MRTSSSYTAHHPDPHKRADHSLREFFEELSKGWSSTNESWISKHCVMPRTFVVIVLGSGQAQKDRISEMFLKKFLRVENRLVPSYMTSPIQTSHGPALRIVLKIWHENETISQRIKNAQADWLRQYTWQHQNAEMRVPLAEIL